MGTRCDWLWFCSLSVENWGDIFKLIIKRNIRHNYTFGSHLKSTLTQIFVFLTLGTGEGFGRSLVASSLKQIKKNY